MDGIIRVEPQLQRSCEKCICSWCSLAESNGGAPGCGNCEECKGANPIHDCKEFFVPVRYMRMSERHREENAND